MTNQLYLPTNKVPPDWTTAIEKAQQPLIVVVTHPSITPDNLAALHQGCGTGEFSWTIGLHWLYKKKWNHSHKIPCRPKLAKLHEPLGDLMWGTVNLASEIHALGHPLSKQWVNAGQWAGCVFDEIRQDSYQTGIQIMLNNEGKAGTITEWRTFLASLKKLEPENPCNQKDSPAFWALIEASIQVLESGLFPEIQKYWGMKRTRHIYQPKGFIGFVSAFLALLESNHARALSVQDGKLLQNTGRGKGTVKLSVNFVNA